MTLLEKVRYVPAIRTRRAELLGFEKVKDPLGRGLLPIFEFTRSRRSKSNPEGSVDVSVEEVLRICEGPFIADLTSQVSLMNSQVDTLLDPSDSFSNWRKFVEEKLPDHAIPVVHLLEPFDTPSVRAQFQDFLVRHEFVSVRIPSEFSELDQLFALLESLGDDIRRVALIADVGLVMPQGFEGAVARVSEIAAHLENARPGLFASIASSFPSTVTKLGGDASGEFPLQEVRLSLEVSSEFDELDVVHGDYGCIHPQDFEGMAINWVPRIDVPLDESLFYYRFRRNEGSYIRAAENVLADKRYVELDCWAHGNIVDAARGDPPGKSPAHWVAVRLNYHIERQLARLD